MITKVEKNLSFLNNLNKIPLSADSVRFLKSAEDFKSTLLTQIKNAKKRIYLAALYLEDDAAGAEVLMALYDAKRINPELDIYVCIDFHRAQRGRIGEKKAAKTNATWYQSIEATEQLGVKIVGVPVKRKELFGVQHLKGFIFDDLVFYSGASFNDIYLQQADRYRLDRYWLIENQSLANSMVNFLIKELIDMDAVTLLNQPDIPNVKSLKHALKEFTLSLKNSQYYFHGEEGAATQLSVTPLAGLGTKHNKLNTCIQSLLNSTQHEAVIFTPYFNLPSQIARNINKLLARGVKLTLVVGDKTANDFFIKEEKDFSTIGTLPYLYETNLKTFCKKHQSKIKTGQLSVNLWKDGENSFHLKGLYCDQRFALLSGHNLNPRAWRLDVENGLLFDDPQKTLKPLLEDELNTILANATEITDSAQIESLEDYPAHVKKILVRMRRVRVDKLVKGIV